MRVRLSWAVLGTALVMLPGVFLLGRLALFAGHSAALITFPWQIDFDEGVILDGAWRLAQGQTPYPPLTPDQFISSVYPPLFYVLNAIPLKLWGLNLWSGRALSVAGTLLAAGALVAWVRAESRSWAAGLVAAALWLALGPVIVWASFYKQDILAIAFGLLGGAMIARAAPLAFTTETRRHGDSIDGFTAEMRSRGGRNNSVILSAAKNRAGHDVVGQAVLAFAGIRLLASRCATPLSLRYAQNDRYQIHQRSLFLPRLRFAQNDIRISASPRLRGETKVGGLPSAAWWAILPLVLAFWTKQSALAALGACGIYLLLRDWRSGLRWGLAAATALVAPFLLINAALGGQLATHLFLPGAETLTTDRLDKNLAALWAEHWPLVLLAGATAAGLLVQAARARGQPPLSVWYAAVSVPAVVWTNLSPLANYNHLLPALLPLCLLAGVGLGHAECGLRIAERGLRNLGELESRDQGVGSRYKGSALGFTFYVLRFTAALALLLVQPALFTPINAWYTPLGQPLVEKANRDARLEAEIAATPGAAVLTEDAWLALRAGKTLPFNDPAMMTIQANHGRWDQSRLLDDIARRKFGVVILEDDITNATYTPRWTPQALAALQANYAVKFRDVRFLAVPQPPPAVPLRTEDCALAGGPRLAGIFLPGSGTRLDAGDVQALSLYWAAPGSGAPVVGLKFSLRLLDGQGTAAWQADLPPGGAAGHPWPDWAGTTTQRDDLAVQVPATAAPGPYTLALSGYVQNGTNLTPVAWSCPGAADTPTLVLARQQVAQSSEYP